MTLADLQNGDRLFIDANIFIYHFGGQSPECKTFLERCARRELVGYTATVNLAEVLHRLMIAEAVEKGMDVMWKTFSLWCKDTFSLFIEAVIWGVSALFSGSVKLIGFLLSLTPLALIIYVGNYGIGSIPWGPIAEIVAWVMGILFVIFICIIVLLVIIVTVDNITSFFKNRKKEFIKLCVKEALEDIAKEKGREIELTEINR